MVNIIRCALGKIKRRAKMYVQRYYDRFPFLIKSQPKGEKRAVHISAFSYGNAGDTLLPVVLRDLFNDTIGIKQWRSVDLHVEVRKSDVRFYNKKDFVVIGGGGLFLKDTGANDNSGWQWNCSIDNLAKSINPLLLSQLATTDSEVKMILNQFLLNILIVLLSKLSSLALGIMAVSKN